MAVMDRGRRVLTKTYDLLGYYNATGRLVVKKVADGMLSRRVLRQFGASFSRSILFRQQSLNLGLYTWTKLHGQHGFVTGAETTGNGGWHCRCRD